LFLSTLLAFSRLYKDNEMVALAACGVSMRKIYGTVFFFSLLIAAVVAAISMYIAPWAEEKAYHIQDAQRATPELMGISSGRFTESSTGSGVLYAEEISLDGDSMRNVFVQSRKEGEQVIISSENAYQSVDKKTGDLFMIMVDGYRYEGVPGNADFKVTKFHKHAVRIDAREVVPSARKNRALPTSLLIASENRADTAELQWRLSMPVTVVLLALLAVPLSYTTPRQGRYAKLFVAILAYMIYNNMIGVARTWMERGVVPAGIGMWWVHVVLMIGIVVMLSRQYGASWVFKSMIGRA
jgi:lipopolysaccharide export system permease protein